MVNENDVLTGAVCPHCYASRQIMTHVRGVAWWFECLECESAFYLQYRESPGQKLRRRREDAAAVLDAARGGGNGETVP